MIYNCAIAVNSYLNFWTDNIGEMITGCITIIGFFVTYLLTNKSLKNEIKKIKSSKNIDKIQEVSAKLLDIIYNAPTNGGKYVLKDFENIKKTICAYGSTEAVYIIEMFQRFQITEMNMRKQNKLIEDAGLIAMSYVSILFSQLKLDITGEIMTPASWLTVVFPDFLSLEEKMKKIINDIIKINNFNEKFISK